MKIPASPQTILLLKNALPYWCARFPYACLLTSCGQSSALHHDTYEFFAGVAGADATLFHSVEEAEKYRGLKFGYLSYEYNHASHDLASHREKRSGFDDGFFFVPEITIALRKGSHDLEITGGSESLLQEIMGSGKKAHEKTVVTLAPAITREQYIDTVDQLRERIADGDFYEINYCLNFSGPVTSINPPEVFEKLISFSPTPFATLFRQQNAWLLCASPERFLKKSGRQLLAQPIKGTIARGKTPLEDEMLKWQLNHSEKERAENVMIVDLMRNDLSRCCNTGTVTVDELFGVYPFATVHQMISSISGTLKDDITLQEIIEKTYPMGSMTGAPKREVMHAIEACEPVRRELFSGSVGYIDEAGDFDFNVVIRSILYNADTSFLSIFAGSAITYDAEAGKEYDECMLKAATMFRVLDIKNS